MSLQGGNMAKNRDLSLRRGAKRELARHNDPFTYLRAQVDRLFDDFVSGNQWLARGEQGYSPQVDVTETDKEIKVCAELPGIEAKDLEITVTDDALTIQGEKLSERKSDDEGRHWTERSYGSFERTIPLPAEVDSEKAISSFKNGILRITLPKRQGAKPRSRKIKVE